MTSAGELERRLEVVEQRLLAATQVLAEWRRQLPLDERRGPVWLAYRRGGVDELESVVAAL